MNQTFRKPLCLICIIVIILSINIPIYAGYGEGILEVINDGAKHQALTMTVSSVASTSSLQAFCVGWTFTFSNSNGSIEVYVPLAPIDTDGGGRTYTFPLTTGWTKPATGIAGARSIRDLVSDKTTFDKIIKAGCTVYADARIEKYSYSPVPAPNGKFTPLGVYANIKDEIDDNFSEFSSTFKTNTKRDYFDLNKTMPPEAITLSTPKVTLTLPTNGSTVLKGTTVIFKGFGTGVHHMDGYVDGEFIGAQQNPNEDINTQMRYETTVKLDELGTHTFQVKGRNTALATDTGSILAQSATHTVTVVAPDPGAGTIYIKCLDIDTNKVIEEIEPIPNVPLGKAQTVNKPILDSYGCQGSYQTFTTTVPDKSKMTTATSQTVTLTSTNKAAYVYFWYKANPVVPDKPPVPINYNPIAIINNPAIAYVGDDVKIDGSKSYDEDGFIEHYEWSVPGTYGNTEEENTIGDNATGLTWYPDVGTYDIGLIVTDDDNDIGEDLNYITIIPPIPSVVFNVSADKMKENRKITLDVSGSTSAQKFPIDWSLTAWTIVPITGTGATGDYGVRFENGKVYKNVNGIAWSYNNGIWTSTGQTFSAILKGQKTLQFQARDSGQYTATVTLTNTGLVDSTRHYSNSSTRDINIVEDLAPVANFSGAASNIRDIESPNGVTSQKYGIIPVTCTTTSPDGDPIGKKFWVLRYDSDNDGALADETDIYPYTGSETFTSGIRFIVEGEYDTAVEIQTYEVGMYNESLTAFEDILDDETVKELLVPSDYKSSNVKSW